MTNIIRRKKFLVVVYYIASQDEQEDYELIAITAFYSMALMLMYYWFTGIGIIPEASSESSRKLIESILVFYVSHLGSVYTYALNFSHHFLDCH